jgi:hypothetical protein
MEFRIAGTLVRWMRRNLAHLLLTEARQYVAHWSEDAVWLGVSDANAEGEWFWLDDDGRDDTHFWTEGADGSATGGRSSITPGGVRLTLATPKANTRRGHRLDTGAPRLMIDHISELFLAR